MCEMSVRMMDVCASTVHHPCEHGRRLRLRPTAIDVSETEQQRGGAPPAGWICDMQKITPYLANGCPKICYGCGKPFVVRFGRADAILGPDDRLYCYGTGCAGEAFASHAVALQRAA